MRNLTLSAFIVCFVLFLAFKFFLFGDLYEQVLHAVELNHYDDDDDSTSVDQKHDNILAFVRIPKTGSSSMMAFLQRFTGLRHLDHVLPHEFLQKSGYRFTSGCVFGHFENTTLEQDPVCAHVKYPRYQQMWKEVQPMKNFSMEMETFTMVREPFDLLLSFYNMHRSYLDSASHTNTKEQVELVKSGDFAGWLELMYTQDKERKTGFQFEFFDKSVDTAIAIINENVTVLVNECYEESLWLMEKKYSIREGSADEFLDSSWFHSRKGTSNQTDDDKQRLRENAKRWFADEYKFYHAAVEQFRWQMMSSGIDPSTMRNHCPLLQANVDDLQHTYKSTAVL